MAMSGPLTRRSGAQASDEAVKMAYDEEVWAIFGSISSESTHIALRVALRAELPVVSSANSDPTVPETTIPWYLGRCRMTGNSI